MYLIYRETLSWKTYMYIEHICLLSNFQYLLPYLSFGVKSVVLFLFFAYVYEFDVHVYICVYVCVSTCVSVSVNVRERGQSVGVGSFLLPCEFWKLNWGHLGSGKCPYPLSCLNHTSLCYVLQLSVWERIGERQRDTFFLICVFFLFFL